MPSNRRKFLGTLAVTGASLAIAGCSGDGEATEDSTDDSMENESMNSETMDNGESMDNETMDDGESMNDDGSMDNETMG